MNVSLPIGGNGARGTPINLAHVAPFKLGPIEVFPPTRQLRRGEQSEILEPRVMQVLVALAHANGAVVSRDDLIVRCWEGRIVGDNAIQRTISRLRDVAGGIGAGCFQLETVNKVGYRLIELEAPSQQREGDVLILSEQARTSRWRPPVFIGVAGVLIAAIAAGFMMWALAPLSGSITVAVTGRDRDSAELAGGLAIDLARLANTRGTIAFADTVGKLHSDYVLSVAKRRSGSRIQADLGLAHEGSRGFLWTASVAGQSGDEAILRRRAALAVSKVAGCALAANNDQRTPASTVLGQIFSACDRMDGETDEATVTEWRRIVALSPGNFRALATLAFSEAAFSTVPSDFKQVTALRNAARIHLQEARALNSQLGLTYAAAATLIPPWRYGERLARVEQGLAKDPDCAALYALKSDALLWVGFMEDAIAAARRASELDPGYSIYDTQYALALAYSGLEGAASTELAAAELAWPDSAAVREAKFLYDYRFGNPGRLLHDIDGGRPIPNSSTAIANGVERAFLLARTQPNAKNVAQAEELAMRFGAAPPTIQTLVAFGHVDQAYALLNIQKRIEEFRRMGAYVLFRANMRSFLLDQRFMGLADRLGLVQFWLANDAWPDFCHDKDLPYNCKAEAQRLHAGKAA